MISFSFSHYEPSGDFSLKISSAWKFSPILLLVLTFFFNFSWANENRTVAEALAQQPQAQVEETEKNFLAQSSPEGNPGNPFYQEPLRQNTERENTEYLVLWIKLIVIMGVFCGGAYMLLRYLKKRGIKQADTDQQFFQSIVEFPLGINKKIQVVKILNDYYVLATGQEEVTFLSKVEDKESLDLLDLRISQQQGGEGPFEESLKNYLNVGGWSPMAMTQSLKKKIKRM